MDTFRAVPLGITRCRGMEFRWGERTYIMGIINLTPDSFSGDGLAGDIEAAVAQARQFVAEGADILDIGGESTRPGSTAVSADEELRRVMPVLERLARDIVVPVSIDTYKWEVACRALEAGAAMLNDVWGLKRDPRLARLAAEWGVPLVLMHNQTGTDYGELIPEILDSLWQSMKQARQAGVALENLIVDPGIGFGKTWEQNLEVLRRLREFQALGRPILLGTSRKSVIGRVLNLPVEERLEGTAATVALGIAQGADIVRVHDVRAMGRVARMADAIVRGRIVSPVVAYLGLGSNLGDREENLGHALRLLSQRLKVERISSLYETEPVGYTQQPLFLNAVCQVTTELSPHELLALAKEVERRLGRVPSFPNAPRPIDVDILLYGETVLDKPELTIPHPHLDERAFVLVPLAEIVPELVLPGRGKKVRELLAQVAGREGVRLWKKS